MKNILVPIDFSDAAEKVIEKAKKLAKSLNGKITIIHIAAPNPDFVGDEVGPQVVRDQRADKLKKEHQEIQEISKELNNSGIDSTPLLIQGVTVDEIIKESKKIDADIIVMGSHGHGAMYNLLMGSVIEGVIKKSKIPVLVVPVRK